MSYHNRQQLISWQSVVFLTNKQVAFGTFVQTRDEMPLYILSQLVTFYPGVVRVCCTAVLPRVLPRV
jgi:hypothetical protein